MQKGREFSGPFSFTPMKTILLILSVSLLFLGKGQAQSLEVMPGTERIFADVQWLKPLDDQYRWTIFSRSRATVDYDENSNLFTGAYLNYTTKAGLGATILGRISSGASGSDAGVHYFKKSEKIMFYGLLSVELDSRLAYSWFSIFHYTPELNDKWKLYSSLELFTNFRSGKHVASVQRMRVGLDRQGYQFGLALNLSGFGADYEFTDENPGVFLRKQF